jgi:predicted nucleotidyltransferase
MGGPGIPVGKNPQFFFNQIDQKQFAETLRSELLRLAVFGSAPQMTANSKADLDIKVAFRKTFHKVTFHEYTLDVTMYIHGGKETIVKVYKINSNEGATASEMWNTNPYQGKAKAIRKLLEKTIPDIQAYVGANP